MHGSTGAGVPGCETLGNGVLFATQDEWARFWQETSPHWQDFMIPCALLKHRQHWIELSGRPLLIFCLLPLPFVLTGIKSLLVCSSIRSVAFSFVSVELKGDKLSASILEIFGAVLSVEIRFKTPKGWGGLSRDSKLRFSNDSRRFFSRTISLLAEILSSSNWIFYCLCSLQKSS